MARLLRSWAWPLASALLAAVALAAWWALRPRVVHQTQPVARADIEAAVTAIGTLQPRRYVDVGAQVSGQITRLRVVPGSRVSKGELLVEIDPSVQQATVDAGRAQLAGLRAQLAEQQAQHRLATQQLARQRQMAAGGATREQDLHEAEAGFAAAQARSDQIRAQIDQTQATLMADEARLGYTRIYAPMAGTVVSVDAREGQTLNATYQTPDILRIADLGGMTVWTDVSEADVRRVRAGMAAHFTTLGGSDEASPRRWAGTVRQVLPAPPRVAASAGAATPAQAVKAVTYTVLFDVDNADGELMPQMTAQVVFVTDRAQGAIVVPLSALSITAGAEGASVRVLEADGQARSRMLRLGVRSRHQAGANRHLDRARDAGRLPGAAPRRARAQR